MYDYSGRNGRYNVAEVESASTVVGGAMCDNLPYAKAYVRSQTFGRTFNACEALKKGTLFPELVRPYHNHS